MRTEKCGEVSTDLHEVTPEAEPDLNRAIFMIKPDGMIAKSGDYYFRDVVFGLVALLELEIVESVTRRLEEDEIRAVYDNLNQPSEFGDQWKFDVIDHISSGDIHACVVVGENAALKLEMLKDFLREQLTNRGTVEGKIVKNLIHVPDVEEFDGTYQVLFKGGC